MTSLRIRGAGLSALAIALAGLASCGKPAGSPCAIEGSGFTARDPCANKCLERWTITCPGDRDVHAALCSGREECKPGTCPEGQACYSLDDPFDVVNLCVPIEACFERTPSRDELLSWESGSFERSAATRAHYGEKKRRRDGASPKPETEPR